LASDADRDQQPRPTLSFLSLLLCVLIAMPLAAGFFGAWHPALDSFSHFRVHLAAVLAIAALPMLVSPRLKAGALAIAVALLAVATTSGNVPAPAIGMDYSPLRAVSAERPVYRLIQLNLRFNNPSPELVLSMIGRERPDVVTLTEVTADWEARLKLVSAAYPFQHVCPRAGRYWSVAVLSRRPFAEGTEPGCEPRGALGVVPISFGGRRVDVVAVHLAWPWPLEQDWQIGGLVPYLETVGADAVLGGDFNAVPWSHAVHRVAGAGGFEIAPSPGATWLWRRLPRSFAPAGLPIDQLMAKGGVAVHSVRRLPATGSDHFPVLMEFSLAPLPETPDGTERATADLAPALLPSAAASAATAAN
jgi:endonuclease/exonuclease/phosphatase (EEP) superfamily protein YafD